MRRPLSALILVAAALGLTACGNSSPSSTQEARAPWDAAADSICKRYEGRVADAFRAVESDATSDRALNRMAKVMRKTAGLSAEMNMRLSRLKRPPADEKSVGQFLAQLGAAPRLDRALADALEHREIRKAEGEYKLLEQHALKAQVAGRDLGLKKCEEGRGHETGSGSPL